jgi:hypothetical protein
MILKINSNAMRLSDSRRALNGAVRQAHGLGDHGDRRALQGAHRAGAMSEVGSAMKEEIAPATA